MHCDMIWLYVALFFMVLSSSWPSTIGGCGIWLSPRYYLFYSTILFYLLQVIIIDEVLKFFSRNSHGNAYCSFGSVSSDLINNHVSYICDKHTIYCIMFLIIFKRSATTIKYSFVYFDLL